MWWHFAQSQLLKHRTAKSKYDWVFRLLLNFDFHIFSLDVLYSMQKVVDGHFAYFWMICLCSVHYEIILF